ncbi:hypothetical protein EDL57_08570 [Vibrio cholerae]|nr:hypothetical protein [Vibrio cholerae]RNE73838.1 hypothetical protein EEJ36_17925 [Vibrio cholerae]TLE13372.1 hypothetical protein D2B32_08190 [Vibrio cholerae]TLE19781.1 hypothetical protein D2923_08675 [Vibrio cholerae]TLE20935.1 hypothetical protein D2924_10555 [Vibrio cholerae]
MLLPLRVILTFFGLCTFFVLNAEEVGLSRLNNNCQFGYKHSFSSGTNWNNKSSPEIENQHKCKAKRLLFDQLKLT